VTHICKRTATGNPVRIRTVAPVRAPTNPRELYAYSHKLITTADSVLSPSTAFHRRESARKTNRKSSRSDNSQIDDAVLGFTSSRYSPLVRRKRCRTINRYGVRGEAGLLRCSCPQSTQCGIRSALHFSHVRRDFPIVHRIDLPLEKSKGPDGSPAHAEILRPSSSALPVPLSLRRQHLLNTT